MSQKIDLKQAESLTGIIYKTLKKRIEGAGLASVGRKGQRWGMWSARRH